MVDQSPPASSINYDPVMRQTLTTTLALISTLSYKKCNQLMNLHTTKCGFIFDKALGKCTLLVFSKKNSSCELVATSNVDFLVTAPVNLEIPEQIRFDYAVAPAIEIRVQKESRTRMQI